MPLRDLLEATYAIYRETHPWLPEDALSPKSVVREMYEQGMSFTDFVTRYQLARSHISRTTDLGERASSATHGWVWR